MTDVGESGAEWPRSALGEDATNGALDAGGTAADRSAASDKGGVTMLSGCCGDRIPPCGEMRKTLRLFGLRNSQTGGRREGPKAILPIPKYGIPDVSVKPPGMLRLGVGKPCRASGAASI